MPRSRGPQDSDDSARPPRAGLGRSWPGVLLVVLIWFGLWYLTPGLHSRGVGAVFTTDDAASVLIETVVALLVVLAVGVAHSRYNRELFARSWTMWTYALPLIAGIVLPFHYGLSFPVALYMFWMTVSVFWQDYLTFGLLQKYLAERMPTWAATVGAAVIFWAGHALFLPDKFGPTHLLPSLAILVLGLVLAALRTWLKTLHLLLALHLGFYFVFA